MVRPTPQFTLNADGSFSYLHNGGETTGDSFTYKVNDGTIDGNTVTVTINVTAVNDAPVAVADLATVAEGGTVTGNVLTNDSDSDLPSNTLHAILVNGPSHASSFVLNDNGSFSYTHNGSETTGDSFTYKVNDGTIDGNTVTVTIAVTPVNDSPVLNAIGNQTINEQATLSFTVVATDQDDPAQTLTFSLDAAAIALGMNITSAGAFSWTPTEAQGGSSYSATITVTDNGNPFATDSETFTIAVNEVNAAPVLNAIGNQTINEQATLSFTVVATDQDDPAQTLTFSLDAAAIALGMNITSAGAFSWTPTEARRSSYSATITVTDNVNPFATDSETFTIAVGEVNADPVAVADLATVAEGGTVTGNVLTNDSDPDLPANTLHAILVNGPSHASSFVLNDNGSFSYTHNGSETTGDSFTYKVNDGTIDGNTVTVTINVTAVNDAPVAVADLATVAEGGTVTGNVLTNDSDSDLPANTLHAILVNGPSQRRRSCSTTTAASATHTTAARRRATALPTPSTMARSTATPSR